MCSRIINKLPADYAIKHYLSIVRNKHEIIARSIKYTIDRLETTRVSRRVAKLFVLATMAFYGEYFDFIAHPMNAIIIKHVKDQKEKFIQFLLNVSNIAHGDPFDYMVYRYMTGTQINNIRKEAKRVLSIVRDIPFERHVPLDQFKRL